MVMLNFPLKTTELGLMRNTFPRCLHYFKGCTIKPNTRALAWDLPYAERSRTFTTVKYGHGQKKARAQPFLFHSPHLLWQITTFKAWRHSTYCWPMMTRMMF